MKKHIYGLADKLYETIKLLRVEFQNNQEKLWSNLTISIENLKFHVEYNYENLLNSNYTNYDRHIIWQYKNLGLPIERLSKKDQQTIEKYLIEERLTNIDTKKHTEGMYQNKVHNIIEYNREQTANEELQEKTKQKIKYKNPANNKLTEEEEKRLDKYELYKRRMEQQKIQTKSKKTIVEEIEEQRKSKKNQILNF